jgi:hypothetical protein
VGTALDPENCVYGVGGVANAIARRDKPDPALVREKGIPEADPSIADGPAARTS